MYSHPRQVSVSKNNRSPLSLAFAMPDLSYGSPAEVLSAAVSRHARKSFDSGHWIICNVSTPAGVRAIFNEEAFSSCLNLLLESISELPNQSPVYLNLSADSKNVYLKFSVTSMGKMPNFLEKLSICRQKISSQHASVSFMNDSLRFTFTQGPAEHPIPVLVAA